MFQSIPLNLSLTVIEFAGEPYCNRRINPGTGEEKTQDSTRSSELNFKADIRRCRAKGASLIGFQLDTNTFRVKISSVNSDFNHENNLHHIGVNHSSH